MVRVLEGQPNSDQVSVLCHAESRLIDQAIAVVIDAVRDLSCLILSDAFTFENDPGLTRRCLSHPQERVISCGVLKALQIPP